MDTSKVIPMTDEYAVVVPKSEPTEVQRCKTTGTARLHNFVPVCESQALFARGG